MKFKMIHENYNVSDLDRSIKFYNEALDLHEVRRKTANDFIIVYLSNEVSDFELELTWLKEHPQPIAFIPGMEYSYDSIITKMQMSKFKELSLATPLMYFQGTEGEPDQVVDFLNAVKSQFPVMGKEDATLIMAHGTPHPGNAYYSVIQDRIEKLGMNNVFVYSVEGRPNLDDVIPKLKAKGFKNVTLMPIMMVAGDHANNDMAGDDPDSHKSILTKAGFKVNTYIHGLGENENVRALYIQRADEALAAFKK